MEEEVRRKHLDLLKRCLTNFCNGRNFKINESMQTIRSFRTVLKILIVFQLLYGLALAIFSPSGFPRSMVTGNFFPYLTDKPVGEDGFYMLTVAWNIADGKGIVYNYQQPTTGIQPLSTLIDAAIAWIVQVFGGSKWVFVRLILILGVLYLLLFSHLVGKIADSIGRPEIAAYSYSIAFLISLFNFGLFRIITYGLETGLYLILIALNVLFTLRMQRENSKYTKARGFGLLAGLTVLARLDFIVILSFFILIALARKQISIFWAFISMATTVLVISPWFIWVYLITGSLAPSSGIAQAGVAQFHQLAGRLWEMTRSVISHLVPWIYSRPSSMLSLLTLVLIFIISFLLLRRRGIRDYASSIITVPGFYATWMLAVTCLIPIYIIFFSATHFYTRYIAPIEVVLAPLISIILVLTIMNVSKKWKFGLFLILPGFFYLWTFITLHTGFVTISQAVVAGYIQREVHPPVKVGAFQSGVAGYFNSNVVNLDGKINQEVLVHLQDNSLSDYLDQEGVMVLIDWPEVIHKFLPYQYLNDKWEECKIPITDQRSICLIRK